MTFKAQKALHKFQEADKKNPKYIGKTYAVLEKYDGWYGYYEDGVIYSRAGRAIPSVQWLAKKIHDKRPCMEGILIFEILVEGFPVFSDLNGILNRKREPALGAYLKVHDAVNTTWKSEPFADRWKVAKYLVNHIGITEMTVVVPITASSNPDYWQRCAEDVWSRGGEGVILKALLAPFEPGKKNSNMMKIKEELTLDLEVVGMFEGEGKYLGTLGGLIVAGKDMHRHRISGMTDAERAAWWADEDLILGQIVEVKAMKKLKDGSLREPRFKAIRFDKTVEDMD
jgi:ATP-dependent DNA ligase